MTTVTAPDPGRAQPPPGDRRPPAPPAAAARLLARMRTHWRATTLLRAVVRAMAVAACLATLLVLIDLATDLPAATRRALSWAPLAGALVPVAVAVVRFLRPPSDDRLALLAEERVPALGNAFMTAVTARPAGRVGRLFTARLDAALATATATGRAPRWLVRPRLRPALLALAAAATVLTFLAVLAGGPGALLESWRRPAFETPLAVRPGTPLERSLSGADGDVVRLGAVRWSSLPPRYAGLDPTEPSGEEPIRALVGSGIVVRVVVAGPEASWSARLVGADDAPVRLDGRLEASFTLGPDMRALELVGRREGEVVARRVVPLAPVPDEPPAVTLEEPWRDEVLASPQGVLPIRARAADDHGVADIRLGWIRSRGSGESFAFEEGESAFDREVEEEDTVVAESELELAALDLRPGDVLHLRALARDENDVTGPGLGVSTTRVIRIAADGEAHEVTALIGAPPDVEERPVLSQRMIILMTERLRDEAPEMDAAGIAAEAARIAQEQGRLRARIGEILFVRSTGGLDTPDELADPLAGNYAPHGHAEHEHVEGDELWDASDPEAVVEAASRATGAGTLEELAHVHDDAPVIAINRDLLTAYNAMHEAERALRLAVPDSALPPEYRALDILQEIRAGDRVFVRGRVTVPPVDVAAARGTGELTELALAERSPGPTAADLSVATALDEAVAALDLPPRDAALAIAAVASRLLAEGAISPDAAVLLSRAATAAGDAKRDDAAALLATVRARLEPSSRAGTGAATARSRDALGAAYHRLLLARPAGDAGGAERGEEGVAFVFATARYGSGDWDSAPLVATNLTHSLAQYTGIEVDPEPVVVELGSDEVFDYPFLFLTGHLPVRFSPAESRNLRRYVERGGFVFIDDHNHDIDAAFHRTATAELARIFGEDALAPLPNEHELYSAFFRFDDGPPTTTHELNGWGDGLIHERLQAIQVGGRIGVLYSNKDYASEWNYHAVNKRFLALDNTRFGVNVLVYALTR